MRYRLRHRRLRLLQFGFSIIILARRKENRENPQREPRCGKSFWDITDFRKMAVWMSVKIKYVKHWVLQWHQLATVEKTVCFIRSELVRCPWTDLHAVERVVEMTHEVIVTRTMVIIWPVSCVIFQLLVGASLSLGLGEAISSSCSKASASNCPCEFKRSPDVPATRLINAGKITHMRVSFIQRWAKDLDYQQFPREREKLFIKLGTLGLQPDSDDDQRVTLPLWCDNRNRTASRTCQIVLKRSLALVTSNRSPIYILL